MKNFVNTTLEVLSNEELMAVRGGNAPGDPIIIKDGPNLDFLSIKKHYKF